MNWVNKPFSGYLASLTGQGAAWLRGRVRALTTTIASIDAAKPGTIS
jgi:hypothetical protein